MNSNTARDNTNIVQFIADLRHRQVLVNQSGGAADAELMKSILVSGLLSQFDPIVMFLNNTPAIIFDKVVVKRFDFASSTGLMQTSKTTKVDGRNNTFNVEE